MSHRSVGAPVLPFTVSAALELLDEDEEEDEDEAEGEDDAELEPSEGVVVSPGMPGTAIVGVASGADSDVVTESPSYVNDAGSTPSRRYAERAAATPAAVVGRASGPIGRGAYEGEPMTALVYTRFRHCLSVKTYIRYSSTFFPSTVWFPVQRKPGMSRWAADPGLPFEKTSETVPTSLIGPAVTGGFVVV